ncbi:MAG TPA: hypothetical protein VFQ60_02390 [Patescibacteria group bacterium]|nr:hypothetical protein [Patescibacteria group bacterium]
MHKIREILGAVEEIRSGQSGDHLILLVLEALDPKDLFDDNELDQLIVLTEKISQSDETHPWNTACLEALTHLKEKLELARYRELKIYLDALDEAAQERILARTYFGQTDWARLEKAQRQTALGLACIEEVMSKTRLPSSVKIMAKPRLLATLGTSEARWREEESTKFRSLIEAMSL